MATTRNFVGDDAIFLGDDTEIDFTIYADADQTTIEDVTGWEMSFAIRKSDRSSVILIEKSTEGSSPAGIVISGTFHASPATNTQTVTVRLDDTDSYDENSPVVELAPGRYRYALKRMDSGSETTLARGDFEFVQGAVR